MDSTGKIVIFVLMLTSIAAVSLTGLREATLSRSIQNEVVFNKRAILASVGNYLEKSPSQLSDEEVLQIFDEKMEQVVLDMTGEVQEGVKAEDVDLAKERKKPEAERLLPLYVYNSDKGKFYILSVRGNGLWDEIWGTIALKDDKKTIAGASFDHKGETPGLGAEIKDNPTFAIQFEGKQVYSNAGDYTGVVVRKGKAQDKTFEVDGITGATVTSNGVTEMLVRGIAYYKPYLDKI